MSASVKIPVWMSVAEFMAWHPQDHRQWQLVDGEPQAMAPAGTTHGAIQSETAHLLTGHFADRGSPCRVITAPGIVPRVQASHNVRIPDLAATCSPSRADAPLLEDPVLVIEILSPSNQAETWSNVWTYTSIPSVQEILVVRTAEIRADLLRRSPDGTWPERPAELRGGDLELTSVGFRAGLAALYRTTHLAPR
ncbi:MAG: Uma2 family endonuclease [Acetobacteraceae bacterium]|nr:Uma2 family endonuclease [Acetobacteraceae bacterium]